MSSPDTLPTVAFFGATGDVAGYCLATSLKAGHKCTALARTPEKLTASLQSKGISQEALSSLNIIQGDARDPAAVSKALKRNGEVVDIVVSSLGSIPDLRWSLTSPVRVVDPTICEDGSSVLVAALKSLDATKKPLLLVVSTTGIPPADKPRDVPLLYVPLYRWLLHSPHQDKAKMEANIRAGTAAVSSFTLVKPTLLMDGASRGTEHVQAGTEDKPVLGYFIRRSEVGNWMFENFIAKPANASYRNTAVTLTA